jgi:catechol 2,3-dioxygenase-like lactoylglutathione lyase family enzyme
MGAIHIAGFDHLVLKVGDVERSLAWYVEMLGLGPERVEAWRAGTVPFPSVRVSPDVVIDLIPAAGPVGERNMDHMCLVADAETVAAIDADRESFRVVAGPVDRWGAHGVASSIYILDPDDYLVEIRTYER